jgi:predicted site-specific integrase-resolvase
MKQHFLTSSQVAEQFGVDTRTVSRWIARGKFPNAEKAHEGLRAPYLIPISDVQALKESQESKK